MERGEKAGGGSAATGEERAGRQGSFQEVLQEEMQQVFGGLVCLWRKDAEAALALVQEADRHAAARAGCEVVDVYAAFNRIGEEPLLPWEVHGATAWCIFLRHELYRRGCLPAGVRLEQSRWP